jgi:hypothetical protein
MYENSGQLLYGKMLKFACKHARRNDKLKLRAVFYRNVSAICVATSYALPIGWSL